MPRPPRQMLPLVLALLLIGAGCLDLTSPARPTPHVVIDWANVVQFNGIQYQANHPSTEAGRPLTEHDLGPEYARVTFKMDGNVHDPDYRLKDGDAAFLTPGTPVYSVVGYRPEFRLAAWLDGRLVLYEAFASPRATTGADLLDIGGKVRSIGVTSIDDVTTELAAITGAAQVDRLVDLVLAAPVDQRNHEKHGQQYFIVFHLDDGTAVSRAYWPETGELGFGIMLPAEFAEAVQAALNQ